MSTTGHTFYVIKDSSAIYHLGSLGKCWEYIESSAMFVNKERHTIIDNDSRKRFCNNIGEIKTSRRAEFNALKESHDVITKESWMP
jgi:hypothetical protein